MKAQLKMHHGTPTVFIDDQPAFFGGHLIGSMDLQQMLLEQPYMRRYAEAGVHIYSTGAPNETWSGPRQFKLPKSAEIVYDLFEQRLLARDTAVFQVTLPPASTALYFVGPENLLPPAAQAWPII